MCSIHGLNFEKNGSDMLIVAELVYASGEGDGTALPVCEPPVERTRSPFSEGQAGHQPDSKAFFVWGKTDAGPNEKNWEYSQEIKPGESGRLQHLVDGLAAGAELFYRVYVDGPHGIAWSVDTQRTSTLAKGNLVARPDSYQVEAGEVLRLAKRSEGVQGNDVGVRAVTRSLLLAKPKNGRVTLNANGTFIHPERWFRREGSFELR